MELSGKVLDNWAAKTSNYLAEELDAEPGTTVELDLPAHWKTLVWALGAWQAGCPLALSADSGAQVRATADNPEPRSRGETRRCGSASGAGHVLAGRPSGRNQRLRRRSPFLRRHLDRTGLPTTSRRWHLPAARERNRHRVQRPARAWTGMPPDALVMLAPAEAGTGADPRNGTGGLVRAAERWCSPAAGVEATERMLAAERVTARLGA